MTPLGTNENNPLTKQDTSTYSLKEQIQGKFQDKLNLNKCARAHSCSHLLGTLYKNKIK